MGSIDVDWHPSILFHAIQISFPEMDAALLKEREAFKKRALAQPTVEKKVRKDEPANKKAKLPSEWDVFIVSKCLIVPLVFV